MRHTYLDYKLANTRAYLFGEGLLTWGMAPKLTKGSSAKNQSISGGPIHLTKDFNSARIGVTIGLEIGVHNFGRAMSDLRWMILVQIIGNFPDWTKLLRVSSPMVACIRRPDRRHLTALAA